MTMKLLESLEAVYNIFYSSRIFLTASEKLALKQHVVAMGECHMWLREDARTRHELSWQVLPKVHQTQHLPKQADLINPRYTMNYCEESCAGILAMIWGGSLDGRYEGTVQLAVLYKYLVLLEHKLNL